MTLLKHIRDFDGALAALVALWGISEKEPSLRENALAAVGWIGLLGAIAHIVLILLSLFAPKPPNAPK